MYPNVSRGGALKGSQKGFQQCIENVSQRIPMYPGEVLSGSQGFPKRIPTVYRKCIPMYPREVPSEKRNSQLDSFIAKGNLVQVPWFETEFLARIRYAQRNPYLGSFVFQGIIRKS